MNPLGRRARLLPVATALLLILSGCGIAGMVSTANRPDMTASVPPSGDRHVTAGKHHKAKHAKARHAKARHAKARHPKAKQAPRSAGAWVETVDRSGVRFKLPTRVPPQSTATEVGSVSLPARLFDTRTADGSEVVASVSDRGGYRGHVNLGLLQTGVNKLVDGMRAGGSPDARLDHVRQTTVAGRPGMDFGISFSASGSHRYWLFRYVVPPNAVVCLQTVGVGDDAGATRDRVVALHARLTRSLRVG